MIDSPINFVAILIIKEYGIKKEYLLVKSDTYRHQKGEKSMRPSINFIKQNDNLMASFQ